MARFTGDGGSRPRRQWQDDPDRRHQAGAARQAISFSTIQAFLSAAALSHTRKRAAQCARRKDAVADFAGGMAVFFAVALADRMDQTGSSGPLLDRKSTRLNSSH